MSTIFRQRVEAGNGPVVFNVPAERPAGAQAWILDVCDGWKSSPDITANGTDLGALRDGTVDAEFFPMRSRFVTVGGAIVGSSEAVAEGLQDILIRDAFPRNQKLRLVRYEAVPKYIEFRRAAGVNTEWTVQNGFRWDATLKCADPLKYGTSQEVASAGTAGASESGMTFPVTFPFSFSALTTGSPITTAVIVNRGTAHSSHVLAELSGPLPTGGWRLRNDTTDGEIWFDIGLGVGETFTLDFANQLTMLNGFPFLGRRSGDWWRLAPGPNEIRLYADFDAAAGVTITAESAWE